MFAVYGLALGIASAGLASIWPDLFWTALVILSEVVFPLSRCIRSSSGVSN